MSETTTLTGLITRFIFRDPDTGSTVAALANGSTVTGCDSGDVLVKQREYRFTGSWVDHPRYGRQFRFHRVEVTQPVTKAGAISYLTATCPHVGQVTAGKLWAAYGQEAVRVLREQPETVVASHIMTEAQARAAAQALRDAAAFEQVRLDLHGLFAGKGFPMNTVIRESLRRWKSRAAVVIRRNPFALMMAGITGCGFVRCDRLWVALGNPPGALRRIMFAIWYGLLSGSVGHGDTWHPVGAAIDVAVSKGATAAQAKKAVEMGRRARWLAVRQGRTNEVFVAVMEQAEAEQRLATRVRELARWRTR